MIAVILSGGRGTRLNLTDIPKSMVEIDGIPLLQRQIESLRDSGVDHIYLLCYYLGDKIFKYFLDGKSFGIKISYIFDPFPLGTAGSLALLQNIICEDFILVYGDIFFKHIDINKLYTWHISNKSDFTAIVHPSTHIYDSDLIVLNPHNEIIKIYSKEDERPQYFSNIGNAAFYVISSKLLLNIPYGIKQDLFKDVIPTLMNKDLKIFGYKSSDLLMDIGTPERKSKLENLIQSKSFLLDKKRPAFFLDRDGVINKYVPDIKNIDDIHLIDGVVDAMKKIQDKGFLLIVITNQPGIAKGFFTFEDLEKMHHKIETLLSEKGVFIDKFYFCPHHPETGFLGEISSLKINCECRKPQTGLLKEAFKDFNIDLDNSYMVGDSSRDILAGKNIGLKTIFVNGEENPSAQEIKADFIFESLQDYVNNFLEGIWKK